MSKREITEKVSLPLGQDLKAQIVPQRLALVSCSQKRAGDETHTDQRVYGQAADDTCNSRHERVYRVLKADEGSLGGGQGS
jgi:hypothetical protein